MQRIAVAVLALVSLGVTYAAPQAGTTPPTQTDTKKDKGKKKKPEKPPKPKKDKDTKDQKGKNDKGGKQG